MAASPETGKTHPRPRSALRPRPGKLGEDARATGPLSALWYLIFILPMFLFTPDAGKGKPLGIAVREGSPNSRRRIGEARQRAGIFRFLIARMIYQDGVNALLALGGAFAAAMFGWSITEIGIFGIILNVVADLRLPGRQPARHGARLEDRRDDLAGDADHRHDRHRLDRAGLHAVRR